MEQNIQKINFLRPFLRGFFFCSTLILLTPASAKLFQNNYVSFELPEGWNCRLEVTEWTCQGPNVAQKEAIIILAAKEVGPSDSLQQYTAYLKAPKNIIDLKGKPLRSTVQRVQNRKIAHHDWVDGRHLSSEIPYYYTRYLATTKHRVAVLVTFSAKKSVFTKYSHAFIRAIKSLRVTATGSLSSKSGSSSGAGGGYGGTIGGNVQSAFPLDVYGSEDLPAEPDAKKRRMKRLLILLLLGIGSIALYFFLAKDDD